ncbi:hypothetical protein [Nonlabens sp.]|uniref:hypothetical protein n=1 Tax=Nonlabens sp. TaxID=1888209 RepID=UPI003265631E
MEKSFKQKFCDFDKRGLVFPLIATRYKYIGLAISAISVIGLLSFKLLEIASLDLWSGVFKSFILSGLIITMLSKEKLEDERIKNLRFRAFAFAFLLAVVMIVFMPFAALLIDSVIGRFPLVWEQDQSVFYIISTMIFFQMMYFNIFKRQL